MFRFKDKSRDIGISRVGVKQKIVFNSLSGLIPKDIDFIIPCSCIQPRVENNSVVIYFIPNPIPFHLKEQGYYETVKRVTVTFEKQENIDLTIKTKVIK
jgi:hypothetical protein